MKPWTYILATALAICAGQALAQKAADKPNKAPPSTAAPAPIMIAPTAIGEIPPARPVTILGIVTAASPAHFTLNDGGAAIIVSAGPGWREAVGVKEGDRIQVTGQLDRYGSGMFMAGSIMTTEGKSVPVKPYR